MNVMKETEDYSRGFSDGWLAAVSLAHLRPKPYDFELGTHNDKTIAQKHGVSLQTIRNRRIALKIKPSRKHSFRKPVPDFYDKLGKHPDSYIARLTGLSRERIRQIRSEHRIAKHVKKRRMAECEFCGKEFEKHFKEQHCSRLCWSMNMRNRALKPCEICGAEFFNIQHARVKTCGRVCAGKLMSRQRTGKKRTASAG